MLDAQVYVLSVSVLTLSATWMASTKRALALTNKESRKKRETRVHAAQFIALANVLGGAGYSIPVLANSENLPYHVVLMTLVHIIVIAWALQVIDHYRNNVI